MGSNSLFCRGHMSNTGHHKDSDNPNANVNPKCVPTDRLLAFYRFS